MINCRNDGVIMIKNYEEEYFNDICNIVLKCWSGEVDMDEELENFIYSFLARYYLCNTDLSFVDVSHNVNAFIFASRINDSNDCMEFWNSELLGLEARNKFKANEYLEYLNYNHDKVLNHMDNDSVYLALIASVKPKSGELLLNKLKEEAKKLKLKDIYLWTDETCNYKYYEKHGFNLVEEYNVSLFNRNLRTFIYRLEL